MGKCSKYKIVLPTNMSADGLLNLTFPSRDNHSYLCYISAQAWVWPSLLIFSIIHKFHLCSLTGLYILVVSCALISMMFSVCSVALWGSFHWDWVGDWKESEVGGSGGSNQSLVVRVSGKENPHLNIFNRLNFFLFPSPHMLKS